MNPLPQPPSPKDLVIDIDSDEPGDNTVRPSRPELRAALEALREKQRRWGTLEGTLDEQGIVHPLCGNVDFDGPEDNAIRPCRPERRAALEAEREKLRQLGALPPAPAEEPPAENPGNNQGTTES